jgi:4'-phosphopantetheinyl transferase
LSLGVAPAEVSIIRGERGRPQIAGHATHDFNVSHTGDVAIIGTLSDARVGVDVERIDRRINTAGIARKFLTDNERAFIAPLNAENARRAVLTLWTCKEAISKATGDALSAPFASLDVDLHDGRTLRHGAGVYRPEQWSLYAASVPDHFIATIAVWRPA